MVAWAAPSPASASDDAPLTPAQVDSWRANAFVVVDGLFDAASVAAVGAALRGVYPDAGPASAQTPLYGETAINDLTRDFPYPEPGMLPCNNLALHPRYIRAVCQLLGVRAAHVPCRPRARPPRADARRAPWRGRRTRC
jgi:hypothetical protein